MLLFCDGFTHLLLYFAIPNTGLKKVTSDMQTHKNTTLRSGPAPFKAPVSLPSPGSRAPAPAVDKPPVFTRDGKKWLIVSIKLNVFFLRLY